MGIIACCKKTLTIFYSLFSTLSHLSEVVVLSRSPLSFLFSLFYLPPLKNLSSLSPPISLVLRHGCDFFLIVWDRLWCNGGVKIGGCESWCGYGFVMWNVGWSESELVKHTGEATILSLLSISLILFLFLFLCSCFSHLWPNLSLFIDFNGGGGGLWGWWIVVVGWGVMDCFAWFFFLINFFNIIEFF